MKEIKKYNEEDYYTKNKKERRKKYIKQYNEQNKEALKEYQKDYYQANKPRIQEYLKKYTERKKQYIKIHHYIFICVFHLFDLYHLN